MSIAGDDDEVAKDCISPNPDVFSYFMLKAPTERRHHHHFTVDAFTSYLLVFVTLFIQGVLLFCVYEKVIVRNTNWHDGIVNTGQDWNIVMPKSAGCNDGQSLCTVENGTYTCAPPSVQLIGRWEELDTDKDGVWTREEVMGARETLRCKYAVDPLEVFNVVVSLLKEREEHIWIHPDVHARKAVPKSYFTYIMGDIAMCSYRNVDFCGNLISRGFFDVPLKKGGVPRVGSTISSALDYCANLLEERGLCERVLPSTYSTWKIESVQECEEPKYSKFVYQDDDGSIKSLLQVDYEARQRYHVAQTPIYLVYKTCIMLIWMLLIVSQMREVGKTMNWVFQLPVLTDEEEQKESARRRELRKSGVNVEHHHEMAIAGVSRRHQVALGIVTCVRVFMLGVLMWVGLNFLGRQTDYIGLLLDGVALIFIVEVANILYERVLRQEVRTHWEDRDPIEITKVGLKELLSRPDITDLLWFALIFVMAVVFLLYYTKLIVVPLYDALECTCTSSGQSCREAHTFSKAFWDQYWAKDVPSSIEGIKDLKGQFSSQSAAAAKQAVSLLSKFRHAHPHHG